MNRRLLAPLLCCLFAAACASGPATPTPRNGGTLFVSLPADPDSLNPLVANDPVSAQAYTPLFPLLYAANADLSAGPDLASALPSVSAGGTVLTIPLRSGAKWSDGMPISADDVVYTITTEMNAGLQTHAAFHWSGVKSVAKVDALTVKITLAAPDATLVADSLVTPIVPQHALAQVPLGHMAQDPFSAAPTVTGGPFTFDHRTAGKAIFLNANPNYFLGGPHIAHVVETVVADSMQVVSQLENGKLSWAPGIGADAAASAASAPGLTITAFPQTALDAVVFNVRAGRVFADQAVRQAFAYSIDHDSLVTQATGNAQGYSVWGDVNPRSWAFDQDVAKQYMPDSAKAHQLLTGDGWSLGTGAATKAGRSLIATLLFPKSDPSRAAAAPLLTQESRANGFDVTSTGLDDASFSAALGSGNFDAAIVSLSTGLDPDDSAFLASNGAQNYGGYANPSVDSLLAMERTAVASATQNAQQLRKPMFDRIEQLVSTDLPFYFLWVPRVYTGFGATVAGVAGAGAQLVNDRADSYYRDWFLTS